MLQVCWEGAADSLWVQRGGKPVGTALVVLPRTGTCILVGMAGLGSETPVLVKGVCVFPRKLGLAMESRFEKAKARAGFPVQLEVCGADGKRREASPEEEAWRSKAGDE